MTKARTIIQWKSLPLWIRLGSIILAIIILLGIVAGIYLNRLITSQLGQIIRKESNGLYNLQYKDVHVNLFAGKITISDAQLQADTVVFKKELSTSTVPPFLVSGKFPSIKVSGIRWINFIFSNKLGADRLTLENPAIVVTRYILKDTNSDNENSQRIGDLFEKVLHTPRVRNVTINNANFEYYSIDEKRKGTIYEFNKLNLDVRNLPTKSEPGKSQEVSGITAKISFDEYEFRTGDSLYIMGLKGFSYSSANKTIVISRFNIKPRLSEKEYASKLPYQRERNDVNLENLRLEEVELLPLIASGELNINHAIVEKGQWNIFLSRIPPLPSIRKKVVPTQPLLSISSKVYVANLDIKSLQLNYREYNTATRETGEIKFNDINGRATNITNEEYRIEKNPHLVIDLNARLMGKGDFKARFEFLLNDTTGRFSVDAHLGKMEAIHLNPGFIPLNKVEIKKGTIDEMHCTGSGNENGLKGNVTLLYHDLHIAVMEKDKSADTFKRKGFISLVANIFVKNDNPKKDEPVRTAKNVVQKRDRQKSYFNMLWMALFTGIVKIVSGK